MLGKLLKYEFKSTARIFLPLYPALLIMALLNKLMYSLIKTDNFFGGIPKALFSTVYGVVLIGIFVITFLVMIQRFHKNLLGDEGYMMFTLPVKSNLLIISKLIVAFVWNVASGFIAIISIIILLPDYQFLADMPHIISQLNQELMFNYGVSIWAIFLVVTLLAIVGLISAMLMIYVSIALGHLVGRHRLAASFAAYLVVSTITQAVAMVAFGIYASFERNNLFYATRSLNVPMFMIITMLIATVGLAIFSVIYFFVTQSILDKKLNLE